MDHHPPLCARGCGLYGSAVTNNFCSKCYKDFVKENINESSAEGLNGETKNSGFVLGSSEISPDASSVTASSSASAEKQKTRCKKCNRKVGLTGFKCLCGDMFCGRHRHPEEHACKVDFKKIGCQALVKQNPICIAYKLERRV